MQKVSKPFGHVLYNIVHFRSPNISTFQSPLGMFCTKDLFSKELLQKRFKALWACSVQVLEGNRCYYHQFQSPLGMFCTCPHWRYIAYCCIVSKPFGHVLYLDGIGAGKGIELFQSPLGMFCTCCVS